MLPNYLLRATGNNQFTSRKIRVFSLAKYGVEEEEKLNSKSFVLYL